MRSSILIAVALLCACSDAARDPYPGASHVPDTRPGWERFQTVAEDGAPQDEPKGGRTRRGTPLNPRAIECFPAEVRNVFYEVDQVAGGKPGIPEPFTYEGPEGVPPEGRKAIQGQNTWMLWGEGNETFWGWIQEEGYGLTDFLVLLDSRERGSRFKRTGLINQPGMKSSEPADTILGLHLDTADGDKITLKPPKSDIAPATRREPPANHRDPKHTELFEPSDRAEYARVLSRLSLDGVDPSVYGYPSGVVGLRLMPNPDFFGKTPDAEQARKYWRERVELNGDAYYDEKSNVRADPALVRPFRVSMSCAFCHLGPHPLSPPDKVEHPEWKNLSSTIGNQYWTPVTAFANLTREDSILHQFLASQQPGTIDTSLVSTDHINNPNTIIAIFDVNARLERARTNRPELQSAANLLSPSVEEANLKITPRHTPRVLIDGADSIGVLGALARVYLNIGTFSEEWERCHNPLIGFKPQRPFSVATVKAHSVYWQTAEKFRVPYLASFFTYLSPKTGKSIVAPMRLADTDSGSALLKTEHELAQKGRSVFLDNCAMCHSSKQPKGLELSFRADWASVPAPATNEPPRYALPLSFADWEAFRSSAANRDYVARVAAMDGNPEDGRDFFDGNFLANEVRVPVTLVGTNSARAVATNAMTGQIWDNFSSDDYKHLPAVGGVRFYNAYSGRGIDKWGNNDTYHPPPGGPGYYRPASLISLWATAPYFHNNALGIFTRDPSIAGRLKAFEDGIDKLLWKSKRPMVTERAMGDQRAGLGASDPGYIYRITRDASVVIPARFVRALLVGILGPFWTSVATLYLWLFLALVALVLAVFGRAGHAGFVLVIFAVIGAVAIVVARLDRVSWLVWLIPALPVGFALWFWLGRQRTAAARWLFGALAVASLAFGFVAQRKVAGKGGDLRLGPMPQGTPINLIMSINPEAPRRVLIRAVAGMARGLVLSSRKASGTAEALHAFEQEAGQALLDGSKCPDFVLDRGHWFAEGLTDEEKRQLKAFLRTL